MDSKKLAVWIFVLGVSGFIAAASRILLVG